MNEIQWGQRKGGYCLTIRQINKVRGYEINFFEDGGWPTVLGFVKTRAEAKKIILNHMNKIR
jgi:hypothetical protein